MKQPRRVPIDPAATPGDAVRRIVTLRFAEMLASASALDGGDDEAIHGFRLACKRLRFALERFAQEVPRAQSAARIFRNLADSTGEGHDASLLMEHAARCGALEILAKESQRREECLRRAGTLWRDAFEDEAFRELSRYAGLLEGRE